MTPPISIFRQYDIRGIVGSELTSAHAEAIGQGFALLLRDRGAAGRVIVGRDNRLHGKELRDALVRGLTSQGVDVMDLGIVPTPIVYWALNKYEAAGGIQITGSHNPAEYNGFKICIGTDSLHGEGLQRLHALSCRNVVAVSPSGIFESVSVIEKYIDDIVQLTGPIERRIKVVYDCGNGAASLVADTLFKRLGVDGKGIFNISDGSFPNHHPDPTVPENLEDCIREVRNYGAELGIAFDGDGDRIGVVDSDGTIIWGDHLLVLYARDVLARLGKGQRIIYDIKCSQALSDAVVSAGGVPDMWKTGHSLIKDRMKETSAPLAGEMSGHMFFSEGFYGHDDALYAAARLLRILSDSGLTIKQLLSDIPVFVSTPEIRVDVPDSEKFAIVETAVEYFRSRYVVNEIDGARVQFTDGWGLIRASNTQPVLVLRFEASSKERLNEYISIFNDWLSSNNLSFSFTA